VWSYIDLVVRKEEEEEMNRFVYIALRGKISMSSKGGSVAEKGIPSQKVVCYGYERR
jgi:hypothetical protein